MGEPDDADRHIEALVSLSDRVLMLAEVYHAEAVAHNEVAERMLLTTAVSALAGDERDVRTPAIGENFRLHLQAKARAEMAKRHCDDLLALINGFYNSVTSE